MCSEEKSVSLRMILNRERDSNEYMGASFDLDTGHQYIDYYFVIFCEIKICSKLWAYFTLKLN